MGVWSGGMKKWTDAEFVVIRGPKPDPLSRWFKTMMLLAAWVFLIAVAAKQQTDFHRPTAPVAPADAQAAR